MGILNNIESAWDEEFVFESSSLSSKIFSENVCSQCESTPMPVTDNMGRLITWEQDSGK